MCKSRGKGFLRMTKFQEKTDFFGTHQVTKSSTNLIDENTNICEMLAQILEEITWKYNEMVRYFSAANKVHNDSFEEISC